MLRPVVENATGGSMAGRNDNNADNPRPKYRDNDDHRDTLSGNERSGTDPDSRNEASGNARENIGNHSRGTAADPTGPEGNDRTKLRPQPDQFDSDLGDDNSKRR
jgi:hypothetical protein